MRIPVIGTVMKSYSQQFNVIHLFNARQRSWNRCVRSTSDNQFFSFSYINRHFVFCSPFLDGINLPRSTIIVGGPIGTQGNVICILDEQCSRIVPRFYVIYQYRKQNWTWTKRDVFFVPGRGLQVTFTQAMKTLNGSGFRQWLWLNK